MISAFWRKIRDRIGIIRLSGRPLTKAQAGQHSSQRGQRPPHPWRSPHPEMIAAIETVDGGNIPAMPRWRKSKWTT
jgi:hypothetical protein